MDTRVTDYIEEAPAEQQKDLHYLAERIDDHLPDADLEVKQFPVWKRGEEWLAGLASRKKGIMLYLMKPELVDGFASRLGNLRTGKSCILFKPNRSINRQDLESIVEEMLKKVSGVEGKR